VTPPFDPSAAAHPDSGLFGLDHPAERAGVHVLGVPFDATTSYRPGARLGPQAVLAASRQVELHDLDFGEPWQAGIHLVPTEPRLAALQGSAAPHARRVIEAGGIEHGGAELEADVLRVDALQEELRGIVHGFTDRALAEDRLPVVLGGDHSVPLGAIEAVAARQPGLGVLHVDAHADLRVSYEGFAQSHASILHNVLARTDVTHVVQVGLRDVSVEELDAIERSGGRVSAVLDRDWAAARARGEDLEARAAAALEPLPRDVYLTIDVDGLDPALCPNTGTPVPGGLAWSEVVLLLDALVRSGRRVAGLDLVEVAPGPEDFPASERDGIDAIVGARLLYKAIGAALASRSR
jgi:agmatinase